MASWRGFRVLVARNSEKGRRDPPHELAATEASFRTPRIVTGERLASAAAEEGTVPSPPKFFRKRLAFRDRVEVVSIARSVAPAASRGRPVDTQPPSLPDSAGPHGTDQQLALMPRSSDPVRASATATWRDRAHLFAVASRVIRHVLIDYERRRDAAKRCVAGCGSRSERT